MSKQLINFELNKRKTLQELRAKNNIVIPEFRAGDTLKVTYALREGETERLQIMEGVCVSRNNKFSDPSITIKKTSTHEVSIKKVFALLSPLIKGIIVLKRGKVRRAKLYYLDKLSGKAARIKERRPVASIKPVKKAQALDQGQAVTAS